MFINQLLIFCSYKNIYFNNVLIFVMKHGPWSSDHLPNFLLSKDELVMQVMMKVVTRYGSNLNIFGGQILNLFVSSRRNQCEELCCLLLLIWIVKERIFCLRYMNIQIILTNIDGGEFRSLLEFVDWVLYVWKSHARMKTSWVSYSFMWLYRKLFIIYVDNFKPKGRVISWELISLELIRFCVFMFTCH